MFSIDFQSLSLPINLVIFGVAAAIVWIAGTRVSFYADQISDRTGIGSAFMGLLFLALATEVPEIGTTVTASISGNARLAVNNLFGGIILQTTVLAIVDLFLIRGALTYFAPRAVLLLQGIQLTMLLALAAAAVAVGEAVTLGGVGLWSVGLGVAYIITLLVSRSYEGQESWKPENVPSEEESREQRIQSGSLKETYKHWSTRRLILTFIAGGIVIFIAGVVLARSAEALAEQTGLGASFVGVTLLAAATSLPELSASSAAVRLGNYSLAISSVLGSNSIMIMLIFVSDIFYREGAILNEVDASSVFSAAIGIVMTMIYLIGLIERRNRTFLRMGIDSALVLGIYLVSLTILYGLR